MQGVMNAKQASDLQSSSFYFILFMVLTWAILINTDQQGANTQFKLGILYSRSSTRARYGGIHL